MKRRDRATWLGALVAVLVLLVTGAVDGVIERRIGSSAPEVFDDTRVRLGETATIDGVQVSVDRLQSAYQLDPPTGNAIDRATGIYLVFRLRVEASGNERPLGLQGELSYAGLTTGLRNLPTTDPGTESTGPAYAEVDPQRFRAAAGRQPVQLRLWHEELTYRYRQRAVIDLDVDPQRADALLGVPRSTILPIPRATARGI